MKELVGIIVKHLVHNPDQVSINEVDTDEALTLEIRVADEDVGRVIGKQGRIIKAIRTVVKASSVSLEKKVMVEIVNE